MARLFLIGGMMASVLLSLSLQRAQFTAGRPASDHTRMDAEGEVSDVNCSGVELMLKLSASNNRKFKLHARDYTRVEISEDVPFQAGDFNPCAELEGKTATIAFVTVNGKSYDGEIQSMEVDTRKKK